MNTTPQILPPEDGKCIPRKRAERTSEILWDAVDWTFQNSKISAMLGCSSSTVSEYRRKHHIPRSPHRYEHIPKSEKYKYNHRYPWYSINWALQDAIITKILGCASDTVGSYRRRNRLPPSFHKNRRKRQSQYPWDSVDWTLQDTVIARQFGCTPGTVGAARARAGAPPSPHHGKITVPNKYNWAKVNWFLRNFEIAGKLGCSVSLVSTHRHTHGHPPAPYTCTHYDWETVDWTPRDTDIALQLGCTKRAVALQRTARGKPDSPFKGRRALIPPSDGPQGPF